jgi:hypothetical protein
MLDMSRSLDRDLRERHPHMFHGPDGDILSVDQVAATLRCSVDQARRIPRTELPAYQGPGKYVLYFRDDVLSYLRSRPRKNESMAQGAALKASRSRKRNAEPDNVHSFDPNSVIARLPKQGS